MKILLFTHKIDIDGMGCAVLGKLAFDDIEVVYCDTFEINQQIQRYIDNSSIYQYDKIFVTDLCIKQPLLSQFAEDKDLSRKTVILDHHKTEIEEGNDQYPFSSIVVQDENGKCSGTSLFYNYLLSQGLINESVNLEEFVELTRQYDTWEWKTLYNNEKANDLNILFSILKIDGYVNKFYNKLLDNENFSLFEKEDVEMIKNYKQKTLETCLNYIKYLHIVNLHNFNVGVIDNIDDEYRNNIADLVKKMPNLDIDLVALIINGRNTVSFRRIKQDVDVGQFSVLYGGKGHKEAASCPKNESILNALEVAEGLIK